jgi:hypothetical protein
MVDQTFLNKLHPINKNGSLYGPNLVMVGFAKVAYESKAYIYTRVSTNTIKGQTTRKITKSKGKFQMTLPLGILADGSYKSVSPAC